MKIRKATGLAAFAGAMSVMMTIGTGTSGAVPVTSPDRAIDVPISGGCIAHIADVGQVATSILPLSGTPFSREVFLDTHGIVKLDCKDKAPNYVLEVGYQIAPTADISDGLSLGVSPQFANAKAYVCVSSADGKSVPCDATAKSTTTTPTTLNGVTNTTTVTLPVSQKFKPGPITEVAVAKREWKKDDTKTPVKYPPTSAAINVNMWHLVLNNAIGVVTMRSYVKLISSSSGADDINVVYGLPIVLR